MFKDPGKRLNILSSVELERLSAIPQFNHEQRAFYFFIDEWEKKEMESLKTLESKVNLILQMGYLKYSSMFFDFKFKEVHEDVRYILREYFNDYKYLKKIVSQKIHSLNQSRLLKILDFKLLDQKERKNLEYESLKIIKIGANPKYIFDNLITIPLMNEEVLHLN